MREVLSDFYNAQPPEELRQRVMRDAAEVFATERRGRKSTTSAGQRRHRPVAWVAAGLGAALVLGALVIAAHSRDAHHAPPTAQQANPVLHAGGSPVRSGWLVWIRQRAGVQCRKGLASTFLRRWSNLRMAHRSAVRGD